jgi:hypothetical protein
MTFTDKMAAEDDCRVPLRGRLVGTWVGSLSSVRINIGGSPSTHGPQRREKGRLLSLAVLVLYVMHIGQYC